MLNKIILIIVLCFAHFQVQANEVFIIKNIKISSNNKVANIARAQAVEAGQLKAFKGLVKLHYPEALSKISSIEKDDIFSLVESYELSDERRSATHYSAKLKIKFSRPHVDQLMSSLGAHYSEGNARVQQNDDSVDASANEAVDSNHAALPPTLTTLVIPVYINQNNEYWFDETNNLWLKFWQNKETNNKFVLPIADLEDRILFNNKLSHKNLLDLSPLLDKYSVNNIAIYTLEDLTEENSANHIVSLRVSYLNRFHYSWQSHNFTTHSGQDLNQLFEQAYMQVQEFNFSRNSETQESSFKEIAPYIINVEYSIEKLSDWVYLQKILSGINYIDNVKLRKIQNKNYDFSFNAKISIEDLVKTFKQRGFVLQESDSKFYLTKDYSNAEN